MSTKVNKQKKYKPFIALDRWVYPKNIQWMIDMDYIDKLSDAEKQWLCKFVAEYHNANVKKGDRKALHKTVKLRQDCYSRKNAQNRDMMSILNSQGKMDRVEANSQDKTTANQKKPFDVR